MRRCERCGSTENVQEAHIVPKTLFPMGENSDMFLNQANRILLCKRCHDIYDKMVFGSVCRFIKERRMEHYSQNFVKGYYNWWSNNGKPDK